MRRKRYGCVCSRFATSQQLYRSAYSLALFWTLFTVALPELRLDAQNIWSGYAAAADLVAAAEAPYIPSSSSGVSAHSSPTHTLNTVEATLFGRSGGAQLDDFSAVPEVRAFLTPIKLHGSATAAAKFGGRENKQESTIDGKSRAADEHHVSLAQIDGKDHTNDAGNTPRTAEGAKSLVRATHVGTRLEAASISTTSSALQTSPRWSFASTPTENITLGQVKLSCTNCRDTRAALTGNRSYAGADGNLQYGKPVVHSPSRASFVTSSDSEDSESNQDRGSADHVATPQALHVQLADNATDVDETQSRDPNQAEIVDDRAAVFHVQKRMSSGAPFVELTEAVNSAWIQLPSDIEGPSSAEGGTSNPVRRPARVTVRRTPRRRSHAHRSLAADQPGTTGANGVNNDNVAQAPESPSDQPTGSTESPPAATDTAGRRASESPLDQTTRSTKPSADNEQFSISQPTGTSEDGSSLGPVEAGITAPEAIFAASAGVPERGPWAKKSSFRTGEAEAPPVSNVFHTSNTVEESTTASAYPFSEDSEDSPASKSDTTEINAALEAETPVGAVAGHVKKRSHESLTKNNTNVEHTTESNLTALGPRLSGDRTQEVNVSVGETTEPGDGGATGGQKEEGKKPTDMESIYKKAVTTTPATIVCGLERSTWWYSLSVYDINWYSDVYLPDYLGAGYDPVKGNPAGDPVLMGDPGLRAPVIHLQYEQTPEGISNDLTTLQPLNGFVRPYIACRQSESVVELHSLRDYQKELSADAALHGGDFIGTNSFSASAGYKEVAKELSSKTTKTFMIKRYCIRFEAGLAQSSNVSWALTSGFAAAVRELPTNFDGKNPECPCTPDQWRQDHKVAICQSTNIPMWMNFIEQYGTHYLQHLYAGGKMTYQVSIDATEVRKAKKKGVSVEAQIKLQLGMASGAAGTRQNFKTETNRDKSEMNMQTEVLVIGGRPPANLKDPNALASWVETVDALPMPVKMEVQSLHHLLPPDKQEPFLEAAVYYGKAVGMSLQDLNLLAGEVKTLSELLQESAQIAWAGPPPGFAKCPPGKVIILGFALHLSFNANSLNNYHLTACSPGREKCDGVGVSTSQYDDERIYAACGDDSINEVQQVVVESNPGENERGAILTAHCPDDTIVAAGFGFSYGPGRTGIEAFGIEACKAGQTICTKAPSPGSTKSFVWLVCIDKQFPGARGVKNVVALGSVGKANSHAPDNDGEVKVNCPAGSKVVQGFVMEVHTNFRLVRDRFTHCKAGIEECTMSGKGVEKGGLLRADRHGLFGWCICDSGSEPGAHVASDSQRKARIRMQKAMKRAQSTSPDAIVSDTDVNLHTDSSDNPPPPPDPPPRRRRRPPPASTVTGAGVSPVQK